MYFVFSLIILAYILVIFYILFKMENQIETLQSEVDRLTKELNDVRKDND